MPISDLATADSGAMVVSSAFAPIVVGTADADRLAVDGGSAVGNGGDDVFVLTSKGIAGSAPEHLGSVLDFNVGDSLDLSKLGANAAIVGREALEGGERVSIDFDGDGKADGVVDLFNFNFVPVPGDGGISPTHEPPTLIPPADGGGFVILPVEWDGGNGSTPIPVEPDGGNGSAPPLVFPTEPDGGNGSTPGGFTILPAQIDLGAMSPDMAEHEIVIHRGLEIGAAWIA